MKLIKDICIYLFECRVFQNDFKNFDFNNLKDYPI